MISSDDERFAAVMGALALAVDVELAPERVAALLRVLEPYPIEAIERASLRWARERLHQGFPRPAELVALIEGARAGVEDKAASEAERVLVAVREVGADYPVVFDDTTTQAVIVAMGGWVAVCKRLKHLRAGGGLN